MIKGPFYWNELLTQVLPEVWGRGQPSGFTSAGEWKQPVGAGLKGTWELAPSATLSLAAGWSWVQERQSEKVLAIILIKHKTFSFAHETCQMIRNVVQGLQRMNSFYLIIKLLRITCSAGDTGDVGSIPGSGKSPGGGNGNPFQYSPLQNPWTKEPGGVQSMGLQRVRRDSQTKQQQITTTNGAPVTISVRLSEPLKKPILSAEPKLNVDGEKVKQLKISQVLRDLHIHGTFKDN